MCVPKCRCLLKPPRAQSGAPHRPRVGRPEYSSMPPKERHPRPNFEREAEDIDLLFLHGLLQRELRHAEANSDVDKAERIRRLMVFVSAHMS